MSVVVVVTGSGGLVGSEAVRFYAPRADVVVGIDNDMRARFFGKEASTAWSVKALMAAYGNYQHHEADIRDVGAIQRIFAEYGQDIALVLHTAAQPSHDWAASDPMTDFTVNANGTLVLLEAAREFCAETVFIFTSTNKVYGDRPNALPLVEFDSRWEVEASHRYATHGIDETMSIDATTHSLFGASKVAADVLVQEYGRYFGMRTAAFRGGCLTGPSHAGTQLHGFLAYLMKCTVTGTGYTVFGYKGKQVRDNIHSEDLLAAFDAFYRAPRVGEVYNIGGGRFSNCSMLEAIEVCEELAGRKLAWTYRQEPRIGDHQWWISDVRRFQGHYPQWRVRYDTRAILEDIYRHGVQRWD
ncbi:MAG TPA: NAD-dependent epimerase/dehydratase family protein [Egibacteraceae bacterium]|jgi:CDP-paratose 2-epimerase|nr:NAD-dependent epimerase/dehydratase family protein [Egibacteraceae bacterium]